MAARSNPGSRQGKRCFDGARAIADDIMNGTVIYVTAGSGTVLVDGSSA
jgi:hypothetical protein